MCRRGPGAGLRHRLARIAVRLFGICLARADINLQLLPILTAATNTYLHHTHNHACHLQSPYHTVFCQLSAPQATSSPLSTYTSPTAQLETLPAHPPRAPAALHQTPYQQGAFSATPTPSPHSAVDTGTETPWPAPGTTTFL